MHAGIYTGKYKVGDRVITVPGHYPTGQYIGTVEEINTEFPEIYAYGTHIDEDYFDDGTPMLTWYSEEHLELL